jgi:hypothetical protein
MKKFMIMFMVICSMFFLCGCSFDVIQKSDNDTITKYNFVENVTIDSKRNIICWSYDNNSTSATKNIVTECLDFVNE